MNNVFVKRRVCYQLYHNDTFNIVASSKVLSSSTSSCSKIIFLFIPFMDLSNKPFWNWDGKWCVACANSLRQSSAWYFSLLLSSNNVSEDEAAINKEVVLKVYHELEEKDIYCYRCWYYCCCFKRIILSYD